MLVLGVPESKTLEYGRFINRDNPQEVSRMTRSARSRLHKNFDLEARLSAACGHLVYEPASWRGQWKSWSVTPDETDDVTAEPSSHSTSHERVHLDLGCGKGEWSVHFAQDHPDTLLVGVDTEILCVLYAAEKATRAQVPNAVFTCEFDQTPREKWQISETTASNDALTTHTPRDKGANKLLVAEPDLRAYFSSGELDEISLNFPTPHPKKKRAGLRLTTAERFTIYQELLADDGELLLRTDSKPLFDYTRIQLSLAQWDITWQTEDYHQCINAAFQSEYEMRLRAEGATVFALRARPRRDLSAAEIRAQIHHDEPQSLFAYLPEDLDELSYVPHGMSEGVMNLRNARRRQSHKRQS